MKNKKTYYHLVLDKSGSMTGCREESVQAFNCQLDEMEKILEDHPDQELELGITIFNTQIEVHGLKASPKNMKRLTLGHQNDWIINKDKICYNPGGGTALYDAIGDSINFIKKEYGEQINKDEATAVMLIITDGHENSSQKYSYENIANQIEDLESTKKWVFSYISNTPDVVNYAEKLKIKTENIREWREQEGMSHQMSRSARSMRNYMGFKKKGALPVSFLDQSEEK